MWMALVLACISSLPLSESRVASQDPGTVALNLTQGDLVSNSTPGETANSTFKKTPERVTTPSPVPLAGGTPGANHSSPVTAGASAGNAHRPDAGASATAVGSPDLAASTAPTPPSQASTQPALPSTAALSTAPAQLPRNSTLPGAAPLTTLATSTQTAATTSNDTAAAATASAGSPTGTRSPAKHSPHHSTASPAPPTSPQALNTSTQGPAFQLPTTRPVADVASRPTPPLVNTTLEPTPSSVASTSTTVVTATKAPAEGPAASTVPAPAPHTSPTPGVEATSPTTPPSPVSPPRGDMGPGTPPTPEQVPPEATGGTASTRPTSGSSGEPQMPTTDSCQLSTQGQYLVVTTKPLPLTSVNRSALLAVLLLGVALFFAVMVLFALQAYESYKKKGYTQVDYLINGMYADSEM